MATIISHETRTVYFPVPKNGSSSLRRLFFELENGFEFRQFKLNGKPQDLFWLYRHNRPFARIAVPAGYVKFVIVRDPLSRFVSNYRWLAADWEKHFGEPPTLDRFLDRYREFVAHSPKARFHLATQAAHLGGDLAYFDRVFRMENLPEVAEFLSERCGVAVRLPWANKSDAPDAAPSRAMIGRIREIYERDYALLSAHYSR
jgi:hypothetical protein